MTCWLTDHADVRSSPIEGQGLFAAVSIAKDDVVMRLGGQIIDDRALAMLTSPYSSIVLDDDLNLLIDPTHPVRYGNHSCDPNLWHLDTMTVVARRDIGAGEELTIDYATHTVSEAWSMPCTCGSALCRGLVTGGDWRIGRLQRAYGDHWSAPLLRRIAGEK